MLLGKSGLAFRFTLHKRLLPSSMDAYNWGWENWKHINALGVYSEYYEGRLENPVFPLYQEAAVKKIKASIDNGVGVIAWGMSGSRFGVITGYDDTDQVFFFSCPGDYKDNPLLYKNFGVVLEGSWYYHIVGKQIKKDQRDIYRDSLQIAVNEWETPHKLNFTYGSGRKAYEYLISALEARDFNHSGAYYVLPFYVESKISIPAYLAEVHKEFPDIKEALDNYSDVGYLYQTIQKIPFTGDIKKDRLFIPHLIKVFRQARELEEAGIRNLKDFLRETLNNAPINPERIQSL